MQSLSSLVAKVANVITGILRVKIDRGCVETNSFKCFDLLLVMTNVN